MPMSYDDIAELVPGKNYQFVTIFGGTDYPVGGRGTLTEVTNDAIALTMEFVPDGGVDCEWSLKDVLVPKNRMQWMRRLTTPPPQRTTTTR
jgi:hypothetical protein